MASPFFHFLGFRVLALQIPLISHEAFPMLVGFPRHGRRVPSWRPDAFLLDHSNLSSSSFHATFRGNMTSTPLALGSEDRIVVPRGQFDQTAFHDFLSLGSCYCLSWHARFFLANHARPSRILRSIPRTAPSPPFPCFRQSFPRADPLTLLLCSHPIPTLNP